MLNKKYKQEKRWSEAGFRSGTLWFTALVQNYHAKQALMYLAILLRYIMTSLFTLKPQDS